MNRPVTTYCCQAAVSCSTYYQTLIRVAVAEVDGNAQSDEVKLHHAGSCFGVRLEVLGVK